MQERGSGESPRTMRHERWVVIIHPLDPSTGGQWPLTMRHERWVVIIHPLGPSTGGQWPRTMRHERWVVIVHPLGPSTGGQWPQTMRYGRWVVIVHPLGPSTGTTQKKENFSDLDVIARRAKPDVAIRFLLGNRCNVGTCKGSGLPRQCTHWLAMTCCLSQLKNNLPYYHAPFIIALFSFFYSHFTETFFRLGKKITPVRKARG